MGQERRPDIRQGPRCLVTTCRACSLCIEQATWALQVRTVVMRSQPCSRMRNSRKSSAMINLASVNS